MRNIINAESTQKMLAGMLKENAGAFTASVIDLYNSDKTLQNCQPQEVFAECLKAVSLSLPVNKQLGFVWIVPRRSKGVWHPVFQVGARGIVQLAQRTGQYKYINVGEVYEGELKGVDKLSGQVDISGDKISEEVIGYFAYIETVNGFSKCLYWPKEKVVSHASKYSDSYKNGAAIWSDHFDEMAEKTILSQLIKKYGPMSVSLANAMSGEDDFADASKTDENTPRTSAEDIPCVDVSEGEESKQEQSSPPVEEYKPDGTEPF
jgi:recombination protein RecT